MTAFTAALLLAPPEALQAIEGSKPSKPNVLFILTDDMGWGDLSCYGNTEMKTPNIDRLAAEGARFTQFYVASPICSPSRVAYSTGCYPARWRINDYLHERAANAAHDCATGSTRAPDAGAHAESRRLCDRALRQMAHGRRP